MNTKLLFFLLVRVLSERSDQNADFQNGKEIYTATSTGFEVDIATDDLSEEDNATSEVTYVNNATFNAAEVKSGFIFLLQTDNSTWRKLYWNKIGTIVLAGWVDPLLVEYAHQQKTKIVFIPSDYPKDFCNKTERMTWIDQQLNYSMMYNMDGLNFDFEDEVKENSVEALAYTSLVKETAEVFRGKIPSCQISIDFGWSPGADRRMFQYEKLANIVDLVFITAYDTQSQMFETSCQARPNSPLRRIFSGIRKYVQLGIPVKKMILGVPWYGYRYPCESFNAGICFIKKVPFRGCNCSDAAGVEIPYKDILNFEKLSLTGRKWDAVSQTPYFEVTLNSTIYQIWFDDPSSLFIKYKVGTDLGLAGVGFWTANYLDYSNYTMVQSMWSILP